MKNKMVNCLIFWLHFHVSISKEQNSALDKHVVTCQALTMALIRCLSPGLSIVYQTIMENATKVLQRYYPITSASWTNERKKWNSIYTDIHMSGSYFNDNCPCNLAGLLVFKSPFLPGYLTRFSSFVKQLIT